MNKIYAILFGVLVLPIAVGLGISLALPDAPANSHQARIEYAEPHKRAARKSTAGQICTPCVGPHFNINTGKIEIGPNMVGISLY